LEEKAPKVALALVELVLYVSDTIHATILKIEQWENINEKERIMYSLVHLAKINKSESYGFLPRLPMLVLPGFFQGFEVSHNFGTCMQNVFHSYTAVIHGNTHAIQHIFTVNHWLREVVYNTSSGYTAFVTGRESSKKIEGEVVSKDRARAITSASEQAAESLTTLKDASNVAFEQKVAHAHQDPGLTLAAIALMEAKKA
jgi:hypothetical protein